MSEQTCSRCDDPLERPHPQNANYILAADFTERELQRKHYAMLHTPETKKKLNKMDRLLPQRDRQSLSAEMAHPDAPKTTKVSAGTKVVKGEGGETVTADIREFEFSIPGEDFEHVEVHNPNFGLYDDDVALVYPKDEEVEVQKSGLVCLDCTKPDDEIIWGPDK